MKDINRSQDDINSRFKTSKSEKEADKPKETTMASISLRFLQSLTYTKAAVQLEKLIDETREPDPKNIGDKGHSVRGRRTLGPFHPEKTLEFDFKKDYPSELSHLKDLIYEARQQLAHMNEGMTNFPDKDVPTAFNSPKEGEWRFGLHNHLTRALSSAQEAYYREIVEWVKKEAERHMAPQQVVDWVKNKARGGLGPIYSPLNAEVRKDQDRKEIRKLAGARWSLGSKPPSPEDASKSRTEEPAKATIPDKNLTSMSARFSQTLSFTKAAERINIPIDRLGDKEIDKIPD